MKSENRQILWMSCFGYLLLLIRHGYTFGWGDHAEILPYISHLKDPSLYPVDFYVQHIQQLVPNVRWMFVHCLLPFYHILEPTFFIMHAGFSIALIAGTLKIALLSRMSLFSAFAGLMAYLLLFYRIIPGGNDWYINNFQAENIAFAAGIWALVFRFSGGPNFYSYVSLALATIFHPLAGIQFFILLTGLSVFDRQWHIKGILAYLLSGGFYFLLIYFNQGKTFQEALPSYFDILFKFRQPHHSIPAYYPILGWILSGFFAFVLWYNRKNAPLSFKILLLILAGGLVYVIGVSVFELTPVAQTQWFKTFALLFALGSMSAGHYFFEKLHFKIPFTVFPEKTLILFLLISTVAIIFFPEKNPFKKPLNMLGYQTDPYLIDCCRQIQKLTPKNALFVIPFDCDGFNHYSKRSVYVSFKAVAHDEKGMREWYKRIVQVYGLNTTSTGGYTNTKKANQHYYNQIYAITQGFPGNFDADYALVKGNLFREQIIFQNEGYQVIRLRRTHHLAGIPIFSK